ncbi:MAG TPA: hypothetical protein DIT13_07935, partial [Verrucomicrobiales bacterium]|nr:hypothetical protein [Verrucomicrobiales bacterium]
MSAAKHSNSLAPITEAELKHLKMPYRRLLPYLRPWLGRFFLGMGLGALAASFNAVMILGLQLIFQLVLDGASKDLSMPVEMAFVGKINLGEMLGLEPGTPMGLWGVIAACACIPLLMFLSGVLEYLNKYCLAWVGTKMLFQIRSDVFAAIMRQSPAFFATTKAGELMQVVSHQSRVAQSHALQVVQLISNRPLTIIVILATLFAMDWFFTLMSLVVFPLCLAPILVIGRRVRKVGAREEKEVGAMMTAMHESFTGIRLVKANAREDYECKRFDRANREMTRNILRWTRATEMIGPIVEAVASIGIAAGLVYFWWKERPAHELIVLVLALSKIYPPAKELSKVSLLMQKTVYAINNIFRVLDRQPDITDAPDARRLPRVSGAIRFDEVSFAYHAPSGAKLEKAAVRGVSLDLQPGRFYALVGPSGAGKSTLFSLLLRFYDPDSGRVLLDGEDIRLATVSSLRENIGMVSQDTFLFHDTIRENIRYGRLDAKEDEILAASKQAHAHEFIQQIQGGYDAVVGDAGCNLSGGQKQR